MSVQNEGLLTLREAKAGGEAVKAGIRGAVLVGDGHIAAGLVQVKNYVRRPCVVRNGQTGRIRRGNDILNRQSTCKTRGGKR